MSLQTKTDAIPTDPGIKKARSDSTLKDLFDHQQAVDQPVFDNENGAFPSDSKDVWDEDDDSFPDGGLRAWLIIFGAFCACVATFGFVNAWGVFQAYYQETLLSTTSPSTIAWIGSLQYSLVFLPGLVTGRLFDIGIFRIPLFIASLLLVLCVMLTAQCTQYWQFLLCQGIGVGLMCGMIFGPILGVVGHWFKKRRALALGIYATGSSLGGTIIPIIARNLIGSVGFPWTMRILGFILLFILCITNLTVRRRLPPTKNTGPFINLKDFKNPVYSVYVASGFMGFLGIYTVLTYIDISSTLIGMPVDFSFYLIAIANAASGVGRILSGVVADKTGAVSVMAPSSVLACALTFAWPFVTSKGGLVALAVFYGFSTGAFVALIASPMMAMGPTKDLGRRVGMGMTVFAMGAVVGPPISGAISAHTGTYKEVGYYAGSAIAASLILTLTSRHLALGKLWGKF